ncbi:MAG: hypothetical protein V1839_02765 [archaeon]
MKPKIYYRSGGRKVLMRDENGYKSFWIAIYNHNSKGKMQRKGMIGLTPDDFLAVIRLAEKRLEAKFGTPTSLKLYTGEITMDEIDLLRKKSGRKGRKK